MPLAVPESLKREHEEAHDVLARASREPGLLGDAAKRLSRIIRPHVEKEETFALPPLGMLHQLVRGIHSPEEEAAAIMAWRLREDLENMIAEHRVIGAALEELLAAASAERRVEYAELATRLMHHMRLEEQVLYPATILVGDYLRGKRRT
jgi:hemerythrin HHE cation binding domain-containing protein